MDQRMRAFWWGHTKSRSLCLKNWNSICTPKSFGGLGFRRMKDVNKALFAKLAWHVAAKSDKLWVNQLLAKYCQRSDYFHVEKNKMDSPFWKDLLECRDSIAKWACFVIGDGKSINIWNDPWVPNVEGFKVWPKSEDLELPMTVNELFDSSSRSWNQVLLQYLFDPWFVEAIESIEIPLEDRVDWLGWLPAKDGEYSVKSAYFNDQSVRFVACKHPYSEILARIWNSVLHSRLKTFLWRCIVEVIPTRSILSLRIPIEDMNCVSCNNITETPVHVFFKCHMARAIWFEAWGMKTENFPDMTLTQWLVLFLDKVIGLASVPREKIILAAAITMEHIWIARNENLRGLVKTPMFKRVETIRRRYSELEINLGVIPSVGGSSYNINPIYHNDDAIRVNFDAAVRLSFAVAACCFRDQMGNILGLVSSKIPFSSPEVAEARAAKLAISEAIKRGWECIIVQGDCINVINQLVGSDKSQWRTSTIIKDSIYLLKSLSY